MKLFFGREFRGCVCPQKLARGREFSRHFFQDSAGKVAVVFVIGDALYLIGKRIGKRNGLPYAIRCPVSRLCLLLHALNRHTLSDALQWALYPIKHPVGQVSLFQIHT